MSSSSLPRVALLAALLLGALIALGAWAADEVLGCGGFVRDETNSDLDFRQITVKLYTKSGSLKGDSECAPNSGYYFIPVYDKGEYVLKLQPPRGWSFEPSEIALNIDGSGNDPCTQGKDINFLFTGFGITGKVVTFDKIETDVHLKGIAIMLYDQHNKTLLGSTLTSDGGVFSFTPVQPGKYVLVASHPTWLLHKHTCTVTVQEGNTVVRSGELVVFGFDVSGRVTTHKGKPVGKVSFLLFGKGHAKNCATTPVEGFDPKKKPLCHVTSDETGRFLFPAISPGEYSLIPHYAGSKTKFDVQPAEYKFTVGYDSLILPQEFKVTGFSITGKVMASIDPPVPLVGAKIFLSGEPIAVSNENGLYKVDNVKAELYTLSAQATDMQFEEKSVEVSPSNPELPILSPKAYKVSGSVDSPTKENLQNRKILIKKVASDVQEEVKIDENTGTWSVYLEPAKYQLNVIVSNEEKTKAVQFYPLQKIIDVSSKPLKDINFSQLKTTLEGTITCLSDKDTKEECLETQVTLKMIDGVVETKTVKAKGGAYIFEDVLPGQYEVLVDTDLFCWDTSSHQIVIASKKTPKVPSFKQTGFSITFISSHDTKVEYSLPNQPNKKLAFQLSKGSDRHCLPVSGKYEFHPKGCHKYAKTMFAWHTNERKPIILSSTEHLVSGSVLSPISTDISIKIEAEIEGQEPIIKILKSPEREGNLYKYSFSFDAITGETYKISPSSEALLFSPATIKISGPDDCQSDIVVFQSEKGKIISGSVVPPLEDVSINIFVKDETDPIYTLITKKDGVFKLGPLDGSLEYTVTAEKEGFILTHDTSAKDYKFLVRKLAEINVQVVDAAGSVPLQGVLISLSGGGGGAHQSYRKNIVTGEDGRLTFNALSPGDYYLRPTMKEYRFEPASKMIRVEEGKAVLVELLGQRVAFSAYGIVTCLNGEPESGLVVEARGQAECSDLQEEATTKPDGTWRIRGLEPKCMYAIRLKLNEQDPSTRGLRAIPSSVAVQATQDVYNIKLMALQPVARTDVSVKVYSNQPENYRTLKVKLCREDSPDSPVHVIKLDSQLSSKQLQYSTNSAAGYLLHLPSLQADGKRYFVQLETTLSHSSHDYETKPIYFEANSSFKYAELSFRAERKHDHTDAGQITFVPLPLILLVTLAFFKRDSLFSWLNTTVDKWASNRRSSPSASRNAQAAAQNSTAANDPRIEEIIAEQLKNINSKTVSKKAKPRKA